MIINEKLIKGLGLVASAIGIGATILSDWVSDKQLDAKIDKKISEVITKTDEEES